MSFNSTAEIANVLRFIQILYDAGFNSNKNQILTMLTYIEQRSHNFHCKMGHNTVSVSATARVGNNGHQITLNLSPKM